MKDHHPCGQALQHENGSSYKSAGIFFCKTRYDVCLPYSTKPYQICILHDIGVHTVSILKQVGKFWAPLNWSLPHKYRKGS
uniref:Uncharacterized protein n=1 Tax=Arundo donax TaxID=35708 RepID=A0A0A9EBW5_ARUDO